MKTVSGDMAFSDREYEVKLVGDAAAVESLSRSFVIRALAAGAPQTEVIEASYFDTPERRLQAEGLSLRVRAENGETVQCVKAETASGAAFSCFEYETSLGSNGVWPAETGVAAHDDLLQSVAGALQETLRVDTDRRTIALQRNGSAFEAAFDFCTAAAPQHGERRVAFAEAEIELLDGDPMELFAIARLCLDEQGGRLRIGGAAKRDRAAMLLGDGSLPRPSNRTAIDPDGDAGDALVEAVRFCARRLLEAAPLVTEVGDGEGLKQLRVALRRLRSVERLYRRDVSGSVLRDASRRAKKIAGVLGAARDWDVFIDETLAMIEASGQAPESLGVLRDAAKTHRAEAWRAARALVSHTEFSLFALDLLEAAETEPWRGDAAPLLATPVEIFARRALDDRLVEARLLASDLSVTAPAAGHPLRIALKKMRYAAQMFRDLYPRDARKPYMAAMSRLQD
ncbi:MAG: CHAD domain-containing protein, partial [Pseudomonadota bacterium]